MTAPNDPEFLLAAACCRWPPSPARDDAVRAAAARVQDWDRFRAVTQRQRVWGLVQAALSDAGVTPPSPIGEVIAKRAQGIARSNLAAAAETARLLSLIDRAGYPVLTVKGVALGALAYGAIGLKHSKDIDLLILPEHVPAVITLLERDGYRLVLPAEHLTPAQRAVLTRYGKDVSMIRGPHDPLLELHWRLLDFKSVLPHITARSPPQAVALSQTVSVNTLSLPDLFAYLAVHGSGDGWSRMKWLADFNALLAKLAPQEIRSLYVGSKSVKADWYVAQALLMSSELFGLELDPTFEAELRAIKRVSLLMRFAYDLMMGEDGRTEIQNSPAGRMKLQLMQPLLARRPQHLADILGILMYFQIDMYRSRAPTWLYPFYPLIRLPLWLASRLGLRQRY